jgi:hypothetical protein
MLAADELAWAAVVPCALVTLLAILLLGPPLGHAVFEPDVGPLWPPHWFESHGRAEPVKEGRYLLALAGSALLAAVVLAGQRRRLELPERAIRALVGASKALLLAVVVLAFAGQYDLVLVHRLPHVFPLPLLAGAVAFAGAALVLLRRPALVARVGTLARETSARAAWGYGLATAFASLYLLTSLTTDRLMEDSGRLDWTVNDAFAVLDGRTSLVDYHALYNKLLPYYGGLALAVLGKTAFAYTLGMALLSLLAFVAVYAIFRRLLHSSLLALGLFLPFLALGDTHSDIGSPVIYTAMWPMRYGGAFLLAWLTARHVDGRAPRRVWPIFVLGGIVAVDNLDFGAGAVLATLIALAAARPPASVRAAARFVAEATAGIAGGLALVALGTVARAGALPRPALLTEWPKIFTRLGWFSLPMPIAGLHLALYATFAAAIALAAVRIRRGEEPLLTAMLAWSGSFGLFAGGYYLGRSDNLKLVSLFSAWGFALALLAIVAVRALAARDGRGPSLAELLVLCGCGLAVCSLARFPLPQHEVARLTAAHPAPILRPIAERFVRANTHRGEQVVLLVTMGDRVAYDLGLVDVSPYGTPNNLVTRWQLQYVIDAARRAHAHKLFVRVEDLARRQLLMFEHAGFVPRVQIPGFAELSDR